MNLTRGPERVREERSAREGSLRSARRVAEMMPVLARHYALEVVQAFSAVANMTAASVRIFLGQIQQTCTIHSAWRCEFLVGALAALLVIFKKLKEPEQWLRARAENRRKGSFADLFSDARWIAFAIGRIDQASN
jgi:hypothetical protein